MLGRVQACKIPSDLFLMTSITKDECVLGPILFTRFCAVLSDKAMHDLKANLMIHFCTVGEHLTFPYYWIWMTA